MMRVVRAAGRAALATVLSAPLLFAQNITLVHGFASSPSTWTSSSVNTVDYLTNRFPNNPVFTPGYVWNQSLEEGSQTLIVNDPSNAILVGHSLGGLVSRKYAETHPVYGIVTMGSPNSGSNMAGNYEHVVAHFQYTGGRAYMVNQKLWALQVPWYSNLLVDLDEGINWVVGLLRFLPSGIDEAVGIAAPIVPALTPSSTPIAELNTTGLVSEVVNTPNRNSIQFMEPSYPFAPAWRLAFGNTDGIVADYAMQSLEALSWSVYYMAVDQEWDAIDEYDDNRYYALLDLEFESSELATSLGDLNWHWCFSVSVRPDAYWNAPVLSCFPNDLFISTADMVAPGAFQITGTASRHTEETGRATDIEQVLLNHFSFH